MDLLNVPAATTSDSNTKVLMLDGSTLKSRTVSGLSLGSIPDGDKGDITTSSSGATWTIDNGVVSNAKMANMTASTIKANVSGSSAAPSDATLTQVLDLVGSAAQGDILYRGASSWTRLGAGTSGQYLKTQGTGANPVWATVSSTTSRRADFSLIDFSGYAPSGGISSSINGDPFPDANDYLVYRTEFNPTNFTLGIWCVNASGNNAGNVGFDLQYTTSDPPTSGWTSVSGSTLNINGSSGAFKYVSSTVSISGSPSAVFWRVRWVNSTGSDASFSVKNFYISLWN